MNTTQARQCDTWVTRRVAYIIHQFFSMSLQVSVARSAQSTAKLPGSLRYLSTVNHKISALPPRPAAKKLLVLDLNGTLLYRDRSKAPMLHTRGSARTFGSFVTFPRPYLPAFLEYLSHNITRGWLESMIWSSAQPQSIRRMLRDAFIEREAFRAVWTRDDLKLPRDHYSVSQPFHRRFIR